MRPYEWASGRRKTSGRVAHRYATHPGNKYHGNKEISPSDLYIAPIATDQGIEVEEAMWAVDIVEDGEGDGRAIHKHGVEPQYPTLRSHHPVGVRPTHKHLHTHTTSRYQMYGYHT